jgi:hypothetical protein
MNTPINNIITEPLSAETVEAIEMQAELETIRKPKEAIAREMFNIQAVDLIFKFKNQVELVLSPEWKEAAEDLRIMVGREEQGYILSDFFVDNAGVFNTLSTEWTCERTF